MPTSVVTAFSEYDEMDAEFGIPVVPVAVLTDSNEMITEIFIGESVPGRIESVMFPRVAQAIAIDAMR